MSSTKYSLDDIKRANLERLIAKENTYNAEIARKYGCTQSFIGSVRKGESRIGDDVIDGLAKAFDVEPIEFYRIDFLMGDWKGLSSETVRVLMEAKDILEGGDERVRGHFTRRVNEYKESLGREKERMELRNEVNELRERIAKLEALVQGRRKVGAKAPVGKKEPVASSL